MLLSYISIICGIISGIGWLIGDILLVGFDTNDVSARFKDTSNIKNRDLTFLMLKGSKRRLRYGALIANFTIPFMLISLYSLWEISDKSFWIIAAILLLFIGFSISPVAHVAFYYIGILGKGIFNKNNTTLSNEEIKIANEFILFLDITWRSAVVITFLGWIIYCWSIISNHTLLPIESALLTPLFISPLAMFLTSKFRIGAPYLNGAGLNIGLSIFFIYSLCWYSIYLH